MIKLTYAYAMPMPFCCRKIQHTNFKINLHLAENIFHSLWIYDPIGTSVHPPDYKKTIFERLKDVHNHIAIFWTSLNLHPCTGNRSTSFGADEPSQGAKRRSIDGWPSSCCFQALAYESTSAVRRVLVAAIAVIAQARKSHTQTRQTVKTLREFVADRF